MTAPGPVRVAEVDVAEPLSDLDCTREIAPPYAGAWILACRSGRPLGSVALPLHGTRILAAELEHELRSQLGEVWWRELPVDAPALVHASVVVPTTFSRPEQLRRCVQRLTELDHPDYEVIVVDNRPGDAPPFELAGARVLRESRPGISAARNRGLAAATGEIVAFTDDDVEVDRRWLRALGERFSREPELAAVTGLVIPAELETAAQIWFEQSGSGLDRGFSALTFERAGRFRVERRAHGDGSDRLQSLYATGELGLGSNMAIRTEVLRAAGGFDLALGTGTPTRGGEDLAMLVELLTAGHLLGYEPSAIAHHTHRATLAELERQIYGYGVGFTAMLTAIGLRDPRQLAGLAAVVPAWARSLGDSASPKRAQRTDDYPSGLGRAELRGMLAGPLAYLRSRRIQRRWAARDRAPIKVSVIDLEHSPNAISREPDYSALWALIRWRGRPRGMVKIPFHGPELSREQLTEAIATLPPQADARPLAQPQGGRLPSISVVIPSMLERIDGLRACLRSLEGVDYPDYEVIVVDNRPVDAPPVELAGARVVREPLPGISAARNRGLAVATGEVVAFTDDDVEVDPLWLLAIALRLRAHPEEACVTGLTLPRELETPAQIALEEYYDGFGLRTLAPTSHRLRVPPGSRALLSAATVDSVGDDGRHGRSFSLYATGSFGHGANMAVRTQALRDLDGFDVALGTGTPTCGGEDLAMFARLIWHGQCIGFEPAALVHHTHRRDDAALRRQIKGYGIGWGALLLALVLEDPRHLGRMLGTVPRGVRAMGNGYRHKLCPKHAEQQPSSRTPELARLELQGIASGPIRYLRSRRDRAK